MKRYFLLVSATLLLTNIAALAAETVTNSPPESAERTSGKKLQIPPPPIETTPGYTKVPSSRPVVERVVPTSQVTRTDATNITVLGRGGGTSANNRVQRFADYLNINQGISNAPIKMTITNSGMQWFRILIANQLLATEKTLRGQPSAEIDLTGVVSPGTNQVVVEAGGVAGAKVEWKVTTITAARLDKADPEEGVVGDIVKITGKNFSTQPADNKITFNDKSAQVTSAKETELQVKIPSNAVLGDNRVIGIIRGVKTNAIKIKVVAVPEVTGTDLGSAPPGTRLTIFGRHFAKNLSENKVFLGNHTAAVESGDTNRLVVSVPQIGDPGQSVLGGLDWRQSIPSNYNPTMGGLAVKVQVGKLISKENIMFIIGRQIYPGITGNQYDVGPGTPNPYNAPMGGPNTPTYGAPQPNTPRALTDPDGE